MTLYLIVYDLYMTLYLILYDLLFWYDIAPHSKSIKHLIIPPPLLLSAPIPALTVLHAQVTMDRALGGLCSLAGTVQLIPAGDCFGTFRGFEVLPHSVCVLWDLWVAIDIMKQSLWQFCKLSLGQTWFESFEVTWILWYSWVHHRQPLPLYSRAW